MEKVGHKVPTKVIAEATGLKDWQVRRERRKGSFRPDSFVSVVLFVAALLLLQEAKK